MEQTVDSCGLDEGAWDDGVGYALDNASVILVLMLQRAIVIARVRRIMRSEWELS